MPHDLRRSRVGSESEDALAARSETSTNTKPRLPNVSLGRGRTSAPKDKPSDQRVRVRHRSLDEERLCEGYSEKG